MDDDQDLFNQGDQQLVAIAQLKLGVLQELLVSFEGRLINGEVLTEEELQMVSQIIEQLPTVAIPPQEEDSS